MQFEFVLRGRRRLARFDQPRRETTVRSVVVGVAALVLVLAACGDDETSDALSAVRDQEQQVLEDLRALAAVDPTTSTTGEYQSAVDDLSSSIEDLQAARGDLAEQDVDNVQAAYDSLQSALEGLDDVPLADAPEAAASEVQAQIDALQEQDATAYANSSCTVGAVLLVLRRRRAAE